ncbi:RNA exonuclease 5-like isoform 2-T4 [Anomaloglossus baeobatrachus]
MCLTCKGHELSWVSLVDAQGQCIMDELVKPDNLMITYKTRFSGITKKKLHPVKTKLKDVQERIKALLPPDAVLVGHSLENDLRALQMIHSNVIDTSILFARNPGRRFRLKFLAQVILKYEASRSISLQETKGHNLE